MSGLLPDDAVAFLQEPQHAVLGWVTRHGRPITVATWYDWDPSGILINMDADRRRLASLAPGSPVSLTALDTDNWYRHVSVLGSIRELRPDDSLADIDRLSFRYTGAAYGVRDRPRVSAWIEIESWHGWVEGVPWPRG
jgi:hypothetical protein